MLRKRYAVMSQMELSLLILLLFFLWFFLRDEGSPSTKRRDEAFPVRNQDPRSVNPTYNLRKPKGECICGCNGVPASRLPTSSIDYSKYKTCPARRRRKQTGVYVDDSEILSSSSHTVDGLSLHPRKSKPRRNSSDRKGSSLRNNVKG